MIDTGQPFVPDNAHLQDFLAGLGKLSPEGQANVVKELNFEEVEHVIKHEYDYNMGHHWPGIY